jgi:SAM-dependent methyltransferase
MKRDFQDYLSNYYELGFEDVQEKFRKKRLVELVRQLKEEQNFQNILEVGPGRNSVSDCLLPCERYVVLEPIRDFFELITLEDSSVSVRNETAEQYFASESKIVFDLVILSSVLHEIENLPAFMKELLQILTQDAKVLVVLPNNISLHRIIGQFDGVQNSGQELTSTETRMQQKASFSPESFNAFAMEHNFKVEVSFTSFIKPFPHFKMHALIESGVINETNLDFLYSLSQHLEPYGSEIFAVLGRADG